ncbi:NAD(P)H-dependent oxidoreductase [Pontibacter sp. JH31]|uniref:NAD(P)H-dependent oxidoreductase n=1 Tax=Pontibacter aquaedesilientis TaxID=2766980 RepID=A0ABR7XBM0_9BACT|nr:NAD(P)H-dependent oxidoreductase [Pontibacter aquaedesilientis]MBD1395708.1 NAD(P)H-dependent oxidoreductase [Pontibacter aquaedesilientis]
MNILESLEWRYASKRMNGQRVPSDKVERILEAIRLAPSSMGLQPYTVLVIEDEELKKQIRPIAMDQPQIEESSHLLVFAAWDDITPDQIEEYIQHAAEVRNMPAEQLLDFKNILLGIAERNTQEQNFNWAARQAYIAFGVGLVAAATEQVDATPMEGFDAAALDKLLKLNEKGLRSVTLLPLGYRDAENDWLAALPKVRRQREKFIIEA